MKTIQEPKPRRQIDGPMCINLGGKRYKRESASLAYGFVYNHMYDLIPYPIFEICAGLFVRRES